MILRRLILASLLFLFCLDGFSQDKIAMVIAYKGFQDEELSKPLKYFKDEGFSVTIASTALGIAQGMLGMQIGTDLIIEEIDTADYEAIVLVGGLGATTLWDSGALAYKLKKVDLSHQVIGAICIAPITLARAGLLKGKRATVWPQEADQLIDYGAEYIFEDVVVDGNIVTASGPHAALDFAREIVKLIREK